MYKWCLYLQIADRGNPKINQNHHQKINIMKKYALLLAMIISSIPMLFANPSPKDGEWTIVETFDIPGKASGLAWDGQYLYFGIYGANGDQFYQFDPTTGNATLLFTHPEIGDSFGMTSDGENLWVINQPSGSTTPAQATEVDLSGNTISTINLPDHYMSGIAWDNGNFYVGTYYPNPGMVYHIDENGNILDQFSPPVAEQIWDICIQDEFLWIADYNADLVYKTDLAGTLIEQHPAENMKPSGIVYDGTYLWYVDGQLSSPSKLYKIDLGGAGTPVINVPVTSWNFGTVAIGDSAIWNINVQNTGIADLIIENLMIPNAVPIFTYETFPQTIAPGTSISLEITYKPTEVGALSTTITIQSSDPVNPEVELELTGESVISGSAIRILTTQHDYGNVRAGAFTRWLLFVESIGDENLVIETISSNNEAFIIDENIEFPVTITPLAAVNLGIWFNPMDATNYSGMLEVVSNDLLNPSIVISLEGTGVLESYPIGVALWQYTIYAGWDNSPKAIGSLKDITGDGVNEVVVASEDNFVRCFNGNADGIADILWEHEIYSGNVYQSEALGFISDINGDMYDEIIVGTTGGDRSVWALSGKTGTPIWNFNTNYWGDGGWVYEVDASRDFNGDGISDVLASAGDDSNDTGPKRTFCLDGIDGSLIWNYFHSGPAFSVIAIDDVNGDGTPEALAGSSNESETVGKTVCINGATGAGIWTVIAQGTSVWALAQLEDINADGINDVVSGEFGSGDFQALDATNGGVLFDGGIGGGFSIITDLIILDDVNNDGYSDFTLSSNSSNLAAIDGFNGENIWFSSLADQTQKVGRMADISGDGINDVAVGTLYQNNFVYFLDGVTGDELKSVAMGEPVDALSTIPDINGDASWEIVAGGREGKVICLSGGLDAYTSLPENKTPAQKIMISGSPNPFIDNLVISIQSEMAIEGNISITTAGGRLIKNFGQHTVNSKMIELSWDGKTESGNVVTPGLYFVIFSNDRNSKVLKLIKGM